MVRRGEEEKVKLSPQGGRCTSASSNGSVRHGSPVPHGTVFDHDVPSPCGSVHDLEIDAEDF